MFIAIHIKFPDENFRFVDECIKVYTYVHEYAAMLKQNPDNIIRILTSNV